ncbi:MAG: ABC transporter ATP-binding protein [Deltaproteobacteria bacterium]|nr:ABC transporter ATP-binding protein [Deltaproteobacteria bacterium]
MSDDALLKIEDLRTYFKMEGGLARAVDGVSYEIRPGRTLAVVGESGSGKSVTALSILRLIPSPPGVHAGGHIFFEGKDLTTLSESELQDIRGNKIAMIFQEPMTSLNPVFTVGDQIGESLRLHKGMTRAQAREHAIQMLKEVKIPSPEARVDEHPHQLSGGMRQRVMIAMALACNPKLLIADEPTTALDVTVQAQILDLMRELQARNGTAILFITHDLGVVAEMADDVVVMYAGKVVERADVQTLFDTPTHPYTQGLFRSMPALDGQRGPLVPIEGSVPSPLDFPSGCRFRNRCPQAVTRCAESEPALLEHGAGHVVACHVVEAKRQGVNV